LSHPTHLASCTLHGRRIHRGFTLIELMITVLVGVILVSLAIPSFETVFNSGRITGQANEFVATLQLARMEAIRRNAHVVVCPSANGTSCAATTAVWTGWIAFVDDGGASNNFTNGGNKAAASGDAGDTKIDNGETVIRSGLVNTQLTVQSSAAIDGSTGGAITFHSDGMARDVNGNPLTGSFSICMPTTHPQQNLSYVTINTGGRIAVIRHNGGGSCPAPPDGPLS
jgi:type IV fimbrial biogenesis protein FimT